MASEYEFMFDMLARFIAGGIIVGGLPMLYHALWGWYRDAPGTTLEVMWEEKRKSFESLSTILFVSSGLLIQVLLWVTRAHDWMPLALISAFRAIGMTSVMFPWLASSRFNQKHLPVVKQRFLENEWPKLEEQLREKRKKQIGGGGR